jgi:hypothetical protein
MRCCSGVAGGEPRRLFYSQIAVHRGPASTDDLPDVGWRQTLSFQVALTLDLRMVCGEFPSPGLPPMFGGRGHACPDSLGQSIALELGEHRAMTGSIALPIDRVVLMPSVTLRKCTPRRPKSSMRASRLRVLRPNRSSFQRTRPGHRPAGDRALSNSGRLALASLTSWSAKIR